MFNRREFASTLSLLGAMSLLSLGSSTALGSSPGRELSTPPLTPLDAECIGHLRHIAKLASQLPGDWSGMGDGALGVLGIPERTLRYQLANMAYAVASVQYNRTPAYREFYEKTLVALFNRLLEPDCWKEWINVSRGGAIQDPGQEQLHEGWIDPIKQNNIMYGGHVLQVAGLIDTLYRRRRYLEPGSIELRFNEGNWGFGAQVFRYDIPSIAKIFYDQFAALDFKGFPCEPTLMFPECPQHAVLGLILSDHLTGTDLGAIVRKRYLEGFKSFGYVDPDTGSVRFAYRTVDETWLGQSLGLGPHAWSDGWTGTFMYPWAPDYVRSLYPRQRDRHVPYLLDRRQEGLRPHLMDNLAGIGYWLPYAAELGDRTTQEALLAYADKHLAPVWRDGRYYYPRNDDASIDKEGVLRLNSCLQGNALIPFGRLNVADGLLRLHNNPWSEAFLQSPEVCKVDTLVTGVSEAAWDEETLRLRLAFLPGPVGARSTVVAVRGLPEQRNLKIVDARGGAVRFCNANGAPSGESTAATGPEVQLTFDPRATLDFSIAVV